MKNQLKKMKTIRMNGRVKLYQGVINKSGKSVFDFSGVRLVHRSVKADKSDYIVHQETGAVILAMPIGSERSRALDYLAKHINRLLEFDTEPQSYELYIPDKVIKQTKQQLKEAQNKQYEPLYKKPSYSDKGITKTKYIIKEITW